MKLIGWLWAWLRTYADCVFLGAGIGCTAAFGATYRFPFAIAAVVLLCAAPVARRGTSRRKPTQMDGEHPAVRAAAKREIALLYEWWDLPAADEARKEQGSE